MIRFAPHRLTADCHRRPLLWLLAAVLCVLSGCGGEFIQKEHGRRRGRSGLSSVNGTAVLADMFREQGHKIDSRRGLTPTTQSKADVIVMTADEPVPDQETRAWLEDWLWAKKNRTLIYVGRDYDAAPGYYQRVIPGAPADQKKELELRQQIAKNEFAELRETIPAREDCNWFTIIGANSARQVTTLAGPWSKGIDASKVEIELNGRLEHPAWAQAILSPDEPGDGPRAPVEQGYEVLLESEGDLLVARHDFGWDGSQMIVVANGSFLLNLPLVNHEHRKLAGQLIATVPDDSEVFFVESGQIVDDFDTSGDGGGRGIAWPLDFILLHMAVLGIILCFARLPIFGRPKSIKEDSPSDFGHHLVALGGLLSQTNDRAFALERVKHYHQHVRPDAVSSGEPTAPPPGSADG